jgi:hypothetical protein
MESSYKWEERKASNKIFQAKSHRNNTQEVKAQDTSEVPGTDPVAGPGATEDCKRCCVTLRAQGASAAQNEGATHAVIASFVVLILGFYMDGEFRQKGALREKANFD